jgi:hypothetical protein
MKTSYLHHKKYPELKIPRPETVVIFDGLRKRFRKIDKKVIDGFNKTYPDKRYEYLPEIAFNNLSLSEKYEWYGVGQ